MNVIRKRMVVASLLAGGLIASGCGDSSSEETAPPTSAPAAEETTTDDSAEDSIDAEAGDDDSTDDDGATAEETSDGDTVGIERAELSEAENAALDNIIIVASSVPEVWDGHTLADVPTIVPLLGDDGAMTSAFTFFHSNPQAAGEAVPVVGIEGLPDLHYIPQIENVPTPPKFGLEAQADVGGVSTYVFAFDTDLPAWPAVFIHEGFHVFQIREWPADQLAEDQQIYDQSERNYELALLEDQALVAAYQASGDDSTEAIRHFLALRATRQAEFPNVVLDAQQEIIEGTAEWFEWRHRQRSFVDEPWANPVSGDISDPQAFGQQWIPDFAGVAPLQRFYHTGATQMALLDRLEVDWQPRLEALTPPAELLAEVVAVDPSEHESLVEAAREAYDPDGELAEIAVAWVNAEPGDDSALPEERLFVDAPAEIIACLADNGLTPEEVDADPTLLTTAINTECVEPFEAGAEAEIQAQLDDCLADAGLTYDDLNFDDLPPEALACFE